MHLTAPDAAKKPRRVIVYEDDNGETWEEEEDEDISDKPSFALTFDEDGTVWLVSACGLSLRAWLKGG